MFRKVYDSANKLYEQFNSLDSIEEVLQLIDLSNLKGKKIQEIGIYDCLPFETYTELQKYKIDEKNIFLVEFPQESYFVFEKYFYHHWQILNRHLTKKMIQFNIPDTPCENYAQISKLNPFMIFPFATNESNLTKRDKDILFYKLAYLKSINDIIDKNQYKNIISIGGFSHHRLQEKNLEKIKLIKNKEIKLDYFIIKNI